jgi:phosphate transport system substrate-binding protein
MIRCRVAAALALLTTCCLAVGGCSSSTDSGGTSGGSSGGDSITLQGSGASFPDPLYQRWFKEYSSATPGVTVDYQATGSGAGIKDFTANLVDFGASDAAMNDEEIAKVEAGVQLLPMTAGKVVLAYNLPGGPEELKLSREAYTKIFLGEITKWNDPVIVAANDGAAMPNTDITVVVRADSSGTTFVFTQHLSGISEAWADGPGTGKTINWPAQNIAKAPKNAGVTGQIKQIAGAIGYIEYGYATQTGLAMASLENKSGSYVKPSLESGAAALANVPEMPENLRVWLPDPEGADSYPIVTYTWLLCKQKYEDPAKAEALKGVIKYCLTDGQAISGEMGYVPLPENVVEVVLKAVDNIQ